VNTKAIAAQARIETLLTVRRGESLLVTLGIPAGVLVFFGAVDVVDTGPGDRIDFVAPGVLALAIMSTAMVSLGIATGFERRYGVLKRLGPTPLGRAGLLTAKTITVLGLEVLQTIVLGVVALTMGWSPGGGDTGDANLAAAVAIMALGTVAFAGLGLLMAGSLRAEATLALANGLYILLLLTGGMAFPLERLPRALELAARAFPAAPLAGFLRAAFTGTGIPGGEFLVLLAWAVGAPLLAGRAFRWEE
jgi:ABC-2 type transport system permease protein